MTSNPGDPLTFPAVAEVEADVVDRLGAIAGLDAAHGYVASGGTEANIQAVRAAVAAADSASPNVVVPSNAHFSFQKAAQLLGVELRRAETTDHRANPAAVAEICDRDTALVVAVAGSTEYGRVDPIPALADIAVDVDAACHVDAAWGGFILPFTDHAWGFDDAPIDTVTMDPHKTGRAPIPAGGLLSGTPEWLSQLSVDTPYLESGTQITLTGTRSGGGVAGTWAALNALWPDGYRTESERAQRTARWLADELEKRSYDVVPPELPIVAVDLPEQTFQGLRDMGWHIARTASGETRIVVMSHVTKDRLRSFLDALDSITEN